MELINKINILKDERAEVTTKMRGILDLAGDALEAKREELGNLERRFDTLGKDIEVAEKLLAAQRASGETAPQTPENRATAEAKAFGSFLRSREGAIEYRAFSQGSPTQAGYLAAPMKFVGDVIRGLDDETFVRKLAKNLAPGGIGPFVSLGIPTRTTAASDADWLGEVTALNDEATLAYGRREFKANKLAKLAKISKLLLATSNAEAAIQGEIVYKLGITQEKAYMTGTGVGQPLGLFTASADGISTGRDVTGSNTTTAIAADTILDTYYSIKAPYRPGLAWVGHRDFFKACAKLKSGEGQYLWQPAIQAGMPDTLKGAPVYMSEYAPNTFTTGLYVAVLGNLGVGYGIADSMQLEIQPLFELYAGNSQQGYAFTYYGDGAPIIEEAFARVKLA